uniref:MSP domain-containing protein n=1 Tax=Parascaris univalens TaxID=6257 RepID=A0A915BNZ0_PARUN
MDILRLQEDDFNDDGDDDLLNGGDAESIYDGDFSFHESEIDEDFAKRSTSDNANQAHSELVQKQENFHPSIPIGRLETIHEESRILSDDVDEREGSRCSSRERPQRANLAKAICKNDEESVQFVKADSEFWKRDEEEFKKGTILERNDWRFNRTHQLKEYSWEPSIVDSTPPIPSVDGNRLIKLCENVNGTTERNDAHLEVSNSMKNSQRCEERAQQSSVEERHVVGAVEENQHVPKMSTPYAEKDTTRGHLHDLSRDCASLSAISLATDPITPIAARRRFPNNLDSRKVAFLEPRRSGAPMPVVNEEEALLSSSAIDRALSENSVETMNDTQLIAALNKARKRTEGIFKVPDLPKYHSRTQGDLTSMRSRKTRDRVAEPLKSNTAIVNAETEANDLLVTLGSKSLTKTALSASRALQKQNSENIPTAGGDAYIENRSQIAQPTKYSAKETSNVTAPPNQQRFDSKANRALPSASSSFSFPTSSSTRGNDGKHCLGCDTSAVWFGCTEVNCPVIQTIRLTNMLSASLFLTISLQSKNEAFQLKETGSIMLKRKEEFYLHITFKPPAAAYFKNVIRIAVRNIERTSYSIPVTGAGGTAVLVVQEHGDMSRMRDGSFVLTTSSATNVPIELANVGVRDAFAFISVIDANTKQPMGGVKVLPTDRAVIQRRQKQELMMSSSE